MTNLDPTGNVAGVTGASLERQLDAAWAVLTAPGAPFELKVTSVRGVPMRCFAHAPANLCQVWRDTRQFGSRDYLIFEDERVSYARAHEITDSVRLWLARHGIRCGNRVAIAMRNYPEWLLIYWACVSAGVVVICVNAWWVSNELVTALEDAEPKAVFCDEQRLERLAQWRGNPANGCLMIAVRAKAAPGVVAWNEVIVEQGVPESVAVEPDQDACILYTSGTTGRSKGARLSHRGCINNLMCLAFGLPLFTLAEGRESIPPTATSPPVALVTTPLFHVTGNNCFALPVTVGGGALVLMRKWDASAALQLIERERVTTVCGVPIMLRELMQHQDTDHRDTSSLQVISGGGAPMPPNFVKKMCGSATAPRLGTGYGMTELSGAMTLISGPLFAAKPTSCGRALPTFEVRIVDDVGNSLPTGVVGELCVRGPSVIDGYLNHPEATAQTIQDGWLRTGDLARVDENGFIHIVDRKKDMILRGGENVYCAEVEAALFAHAEVAEVCAFAVEDAALGEEVGAAVFLHPGGRAQVDDLRQHAAQLLARYKVPRYLWIRAEPLPRNASGKFLRRELQASLLRAGGTPASRDP